MPKHTTNPDDRTDAFTFPTKSQIGGGQQLRTLGGLTKREYFAAIALGAIAFSPECSDWEISKTARSAVEHADALIDALNGKHDAEA